MYACKSDSAAYRLHLRLGQMGVRPRSDGFYCRGYSFGHHQHGGRHEFHGFDNYQPKRYIQGSPIGYLHADCVISDGFTALAWDSQSTTGSLEKNLITRTGAAKGCSEIDCRSNTISTSTAP